MRKNLNHIFDFNRGFDGLSRRNLQSSYSDLVTTEIKDDDECDGDVIEPIAAINMTKIMGMLPCAKRGGPIFIETKRVVSNVL